MTHFQQSASGRTKVLVGVGAAILVVWSAYTVLAFKLSINRTFEYVMFPSAKALNDRTARIAAERMTTEGVGCELWGLRIVYKDRPAIRFRFSGDSEIERMVVGCIQRKVPPGYELVKTPWLTMQMHEWWGR